MNLNRAAALIGLLSLAALTGCADKHNFSKLVSPDGRFILTVDYIARRGGVTHDALVSLQEKLGIATNAAGFRNVQSINVSWIGPSDISICEVGQVVFYNKVVTINASTGKRDFHVRYGCP